MMPVGELTDKNVSPPCLGSSAGSVGIGPCSDFLPPAWTLDDT